MTAQIVITLDAQGRCNVQGNIDNKLIAYGMLDLAKEAISEHHKRQGPGIVPASAADAARLVKVG